MKNLLPAFITSLFTLGIIFSSCAQNRKEPKAFRLPEIPSVLVVPQERAAYLAIHYWDHFDFTDTALIDMPEITEQAFADFLGILPYTDRAQEAVDTLFRRAAAEKEMLYHFISLSDKYLYEPNSPMRNEDLYILVLRTLVAQPTMDDTDKIRPRHLLKMVLRNRPGDTAADFDYLLRNGSRGRLSKIEAEYTLLYFNDPDCGDCRRVKEFLTASETINSLLKTGQLALLSVCVEGRTPSWQSSTLPDGWINGCDEGQRLTREEVYDLKAMPTLYLLDADKKVILKDAFPKQIEAWLAEQCN